MVPCPVCSAPIHPVAGRCKHCKEDVRTFRTARPAALVPLPRLSAAPPAPAPAYSAAPPPVETAPPADAIRHAPPAMPRGHAPPPTTDTPDARAILPPRTTGSQYIADPDARDRSAWRNWPVVVIVLACVAIVGAVVVMVWPQSRPHAEKRAADPPPAPDRMEMNPLPPPPDPAPSKPAPAPSPQPNPYAPDPWGDKHTRADPIQSIDLLTAAIQHFCRGRAACPDGDPIMDAACTAAAREQVTPPSCPASDRCLARFDRMSCTDPTDMAGIQVLISTIDDCAEATRC